MIREFNEKISQNEIATYEALKEVFGSHLTHQIFISKVLNIEYQNGSVLKNIREVFELGGSLLSVLLARYCLNVEDKIAAKFYTIFAE